MPRYKIIAHGRVQGVGFRWTALREAQRNGLTGWVRNRADGAVEMEAQGPEPDVSAFSAGLRANRGAIWIDHMEVREIPEEPDEAAFRVRC